MEKGKIMNTEMNGITASNGLTLVLAGTGKIGRRIVARLTERGVPTRVGSRAGAPSFDWDDRKGWDAALEGVATAYVSYVPDLAVPGATDAIGAFVEKAKQHGVRRLVLLSGRGEQEAQACERLVQASGLAWTVIRANWFDQNFSEGEFLDMVRASAITLPAGDIPEPFVDVNDIADVAVAALTKDHHIGEIYEVSGPRLLTFAEVAEELSRATGREIRYVDIPHEAFVAGLRQAGTPEKMVWLLGYLFSTVLDGRNASVCGGVQRALGREPADFADFARRIAATDVWKAAA